MLEILGIPVDMRKGIAQDKGRINIMKNTEKESTELYVSNVLTQLFITIWL